VVAIMRQPSQRLCVRLAADPRFSPASPHAMLHFPLPFSGPRAKRVAAERTKRPRPVTATSRYNAVECVRKRKLSAPLQATQSHHPADVAVWTDFCR